MTQNFTTKFIPPPNNSIHVDSM